MYLPEVQLWLLLKLIAKLNLLHSNCIDTQLFDLDKQNLSQSNLKLN